MGGREAAPEKEQHRGDVVSTLFGSSLARPRSSRGKACPSKVEGVKSSPAPSLPIAVAESLSATAAGAK